MRRSTAHAPTERPPVRYVTKRPYGGRRHYVDANDVEVVLSRLPERLWSRLRTVYFKDGIRGNRVLGYVHLGRRDISLCALPEQVSLGRAFRGGARSTREFSALPRCVWTEIAIRRCVLYDVLLHEIGHMQIVNPKARRVRRRFASETLAQAFADHWRRKLWSQPYDHPDRVHNPPAEGEIYESYLQMVAASRECGNWYAVERRLSNVVTALAREQMRRQSLA